MGSLVCACQSNAARCLVVGSRFCAFIEKKVQPRLADMLGIGGVDGGGRENDGEMLILKSGCHMNLPRCCAQQGGLEAKIGMLECVCQMAVPYISQQAVCSAQHQFTEQGRKDVRRECERQAGNSCCSIVACFARSLPNKKQHQYSCGYH